MSQNDFNLDMIERLSRIEEKVDSITRSRHCDRHDARLTAIERKLWIAMGGLIVVSSVAGYLLKNLSMLQTLIGGTP
jgi:hypothetical protein